MGDKSGCSSGHHHHHHHGHSHDTLSVEEKLTKLLDHWRHHNDDHAKSYEDWERKAREAGLENVADSLAKAAELTREITAELTNALKFMKEK